MAPFDQERNVCEMVRMRELDCKGRARCEGGDLRGGQGAREDADLVDVPGEIRGDTPKVDSRRRPDGGDEICRDWCSESAVDSVVDQAVSKDRSLHMGREVLV